MNILIAGRSIEHKLTVAEGLTSQMAYDLVKDDLVLTGDAACCRRGAAVAENLCLHPRHDRARDRGSDGERRKRRCSTALGPARGEPADQDQGGSGDPRLHRGEESAIPEERRHIASVFVNRLRSGMKYSPIQRSSTASPGLSARAAHPPERNRLGDAPTIPCHRGAAAAADLQPRQGFDRPVLQPGRHQGSLFVANGTARHSHASAGEQVPERRQNGARFEKEQTPRRPGGHTSGRDDSGHGPA